MSDRNRPGDYPPDMSPEYAEAFRRGYERAYQQGAGRPETTEPAEQTTRLDSLDSAFHPVPPTDPQARPAHRRPEDDRRTRTLAGILLVGLALLLVVSAYVVGRVFAGGVSDVDTSAPEPNGVVIGEDNEASPEAEKSPREREKKQEKYDGPLDPASIQGASASCQSEGSVDAGGRPVTYPPTNTHDGDMSTAWRCDGSGVGEQVTIDLAEAIRVGEVGLVPGYAKTDPRNGADRYAENNRITRVRWVFDDGSSVTQRLDGSADNRSLQTVRIPPAKSGKVVIQILDSTPGPRDTVAISEVRIGAVPG